MNKSKIDIIAERSKSLISDITEGSDYILLKHPNIIEHIPAVKSIAESVGATIREFKLRENTLEDVFIHLTGRNLRQ